MTNQTKNYNDIVNFILHLNSPLLAEGKHAIIEEFGKEYNIYFSILQLIANGENF